MALVRAFYTTTKPVLYTMMSSSTVSVLTQGLGHMVAMAVVMGLAMGVRMEQGMATVHMEGCTVEGEGLDLAMEEACMEMTRNSSDKQRYCLLQYSLYTCTAFVICSKIEDRDLFLFL